MISFTQNEVKNLTSIEKKKLIIVKNNHFEAVKILENIYKKARTYGS